MSFKWNAPDEEYKSFTPAPEGDYTLEITGAEEKESKKGSPMANVALEISEGEYKGKKLWHNVTFLPKSETASGIAKHFLHAIGEPHDGKVDVDMGNWKGKMLKVHLIISEYIDKNGKPKKKNEIQEIFVEEEKNEEVPF